MTSSPSRSRTVTQRVVNSVAAAQAEEIFNCTNVRPVRKNSHDDSQQTRRPAPSANISGKLDEVFGPTRIPGAAAVALRGDRIVGWGATGVRKKGAPEKITLEDK